MGLSFSQATRPEPTLVSAVQLYNFLCDFRFNFKLLDCRSLEAFNACHIDTSIHIDDLDSPASIKFNESNISVLRKLDAVIFYGGDTDGRHILSVLKLKAKQALSNLQIFQLNCS